MACYMADVINGFTKARPGVRICAVEASTGGVYNHLASGQVDVAIVLQTANTARLSLRELAQEQLFLVAARGHPIETQKVVARHQLKELDLVLPASLYGSRAILSDYFAAEDIPLRSQIEADSLPLMRELLRTRQLCTILPKITCEAELADGRFFARPLKPALSRKLYIAPSARQPAIRNDESADRPYHPRGQAPAAARLTERAENTNPHGHCIGISDMPS